MVLGGGNSVRTLYELKTARKTKSTVVEKTNVPGLTSLKTQTETFFESNYHHQPTRTVMTNSKGETIEKKIKYSFDYQVPDIGNIPDCNYLQYVIAKDTWYSGGFA